jgi:FkbM family methyltransferase
MLNNKNLLTDIAMNSKFHARGTTYYSKMENQLIPETNRFSESQQDYKILLGEIGEIIFPYFRFGNLDSGKLFGFDELILFSFYYANKGLYKSVLDLGANIGLHTLVLAKLGYAVTSYEPDEIHCQQFKYVMQLNNLPNQKIIRKAVGINKDPIKFTRVLGNTTGSFVSNAKSDIYGPTEITQVEVDDIEEIMSSTHFDLVKMDVEGYEADLLSRISGKNFRDTDFMIEVGSSKNSQIIFDLIVNKKLSAFSQKNNWNHVKNIEDIPSHHSQGSLFIGRSQAPKWL